MRLMLDELTERQQIIRDLRDIADRLLCGYVTDAECRLLHMLKERYIPLDIRTECERAYNWLSPLQNKEHAITTLDGILRRESYGA